VFLEKEDIFWSCNLYTNFKEYEVAALQREQKEEEISKARIKIKSFLFIINTYTVENQMYTIKQLLKLVNS